MSFLPSHFKELRIIDECLGNLMDSKLRYKDEFLYQPSKSNAQFIADTFDISIEGLNLTQASKLLESPMLSKARLGTKEALANSLKKVFGNVVIQTSKEDPKLKPFEFSLKANIDDSINEGTLQAIQNITLNTKPLRSSLAGLDFEMPELQAKINLKTSILWRL